MGAVLIYILGGSWYIEKWSTRERVGAEIEPLSHVKKELEDQLR